MEKLVEDFQKGTYDKTIERCNQAINLSPKNANAYLSRGTAYFQKGNYDKAIENCNQVIKLGIKDVSAYTLKGTARFLKSAYDGSLNLKLVMEDFDEAVRLLPNHAAIYLMRGGIYHEVGDHDRAIEDYDNAVRLCPNYADDFVDHKFTRMSYDLKSAVEKVIELLNRKVEDCCNSKNLAAAYYSGVSILYSGNKHKARRRFGRALELGFKDNTKIVEHLENLKDRK